MKTSSISIVEALEKRAMLSVSAVAPHAAVRISSGATVVSAVRTVTGPTLNLTAGTPFSGVVGFYASPILDPPLKYAATINWGDGTVTSGTISYGSSGSAFGILISGTHTYQTPSTFAVTVTLVTTPVNPAMAFPTTIIEYIDDKAIVSPFPPNSPTGVTITEPVGASFTAALGTFVTLAPGAGLSVSINWGDGPTSAGKYTAIKPVGVDEIEFQVTGSHKYALAGKYPIKITIFKASASAATPPVIVATIESTAIIVSSTTPA